MGSKVRKVTLPRFPERLLVRGCAFSGEDQAELFGLLLAHYSSAPEPTFSLKLTGQQALTLVRGLVSDFVPAFRQKRAGRKPTSHFSIVHPEYINVSDLQKLAQIIKDKKPQYGTEQEVLAYLAERGRALLPSTFQGCRTGASLKATYYKILSRLPPGLSKDLRDDPSDDKLRELVRSVGEKLKQKQKRRT